MIDLDDQAGTIGGTNRDHQFGTPVAFGLAGLFVENMQNAVSRVAPVSETEATEMVETIQRRSQLGTDFPAILELDSNPLVAGADGVEAVDLRLTVDTDQL